MRLSQRAINWTSAPLSGRRAAPAVTAPPPAAPAPEAAPAVAPSSGGRGQAIVGAAMRYLGYPSVWAGASPGGFDRPGFTMHMAELAVGYRLGRDTTAQLAAGRPIGADELRPGDLVFFQNTCQAGLSHVGIYSGGGRTIGTASERTGIAIANIWDGYWGPRFHAPRRL